MGTRGIRRRLGGPLVVLVIAVLLAGCDFTINGCLFADYDGFGEDVHVHQANCPGADLQGADLEGVGLWDSNLVGADLSGANLRGAGLLGVQFDGATLDGADLTNAYVLGGIISDASFVGATLAGATLVEVYVAERVDFTDADLDGTQLIVGDIRDSIFTGTVLVPASQSVTATGPGGAVVTWPEPETVGDASPAGCDHDSGGVFPVGSTVVSCGVDYNGSDVGNYGTFTVTVLPA